MGVSSRNRGGDERGVVVWAASARVKRSTKVVGWGRPAPRREMVCVPGMAGCQSDIEPRAGLTRTALRPVFVRVVRAPFYRPREERQDWPSRRLHSVGSVWGHSLARCSSRLLSRALGMPIGRR